MANLTTVGLTAGAGSSGTGSVSTLDNLIGTAGAGNTNILTVQGSATGTAIPTSLASVPSHAVTNAGTFAVQNTAATPAGTNVIGHVIVDTAPTTAVTGTFFQATQPVSATSLPLPTGAATAALQPTAATIGSTTSGQTGHVVMGAVTTASPTYTTAQTNPLSLDTTGALRVNVTAGGAGGGIVTNAGTFAVQVSNANTNGSATSANSAPVVIASDQAAVAVKPSAAATGGATNLHFFSVTGTPTATAIKSSAGTLYGVQAVNTGAAAVYLKIYNTAVGSVTVGTTVPLVTLTVPTVATTGAGIVVPFPVGIAFGTAMSWALTNVAADNDATAVAVGVTLNIQFA